MTEDQRTRGATQVDDHLLAPTEIVMADIVRALDSSWRMDLGISSAALNAVSYVQSIYRLLVEKGILTRAEVEGTVEHVRPVVAEMFEERGIFVHSIDDDVDKYAMEEVEQGAAIDCENRLHLCHGACCTFDFVLSRQDVDEGIVQWELEDPYAIRHGDDGHCVHQDPTDRTCHVYENRPAVCRSYNCRTDERVWADFEHYVPAPDLEERLAQRRPARSHVELGAPRRKQKMVRTPGSAGL